MFGQDRRCRSCRGEEERTSYLLQARVQLLVQPLVQPLVICGVLYTPARRRMRTDSLGPEVSDTVQRMRNPTARLRCPLWLLVFALAAAACGDDEGISSDEEARRAYLGLDLSVAKSMDLGFAGFNAASSANIGEQMVNGDEKGTLTISGQVDQGTSDNKGMRLDVAMVDYSDGKVIIDDQENQISIEYDTDPDGVDLPYCNLNLRNIPTGTFDGTLTGTYFMSGDLHGEAILNLTMSGTLQDNGTGGTMRAPGTTHVTGTAASGDGTYDVDITL